MRTSRIAAIVFALTGSAIIAGIAWLAIPSTSAAATAAFTANDEPLGDPAVRAEIAALLLDGYDPASEIYQSLVGNMVTDSLQMIALVDSARVEATEARKAHNNAIYSQPPGHQRHYAAVNAPSSLWLVIPGGLMIGVGALARRRWLRKHDNATPPSMARKG